METSEIIYYSLYIILNFLSYLFVVISKFESVIIISVKYHIIQLLSSYLSLYFLKKTRNNPGYIDKKRISQETITNELNELAINYEDSPILTINVIPSNGCDICNISKLPLRSNHCPICQKCVKGFDHHFWILAGCIGEKNHSNFIVFLFFQNISLICSCFGIIKIINYQDKEILEYYLIFYFSIICLIEVFFFFIFCYHIFLLLSNQTTYEIFNEDECPYLSAFTYERNKILCQRGIQVNNDSRYRPFDAGIIANICLFIIKLFNSDYPIRWDDIFLDNLKTNR